MCGLLLLPVDIGLSVLWMQIWDLADPGGKGCLDKHAFFVSLKLVALAQNGKEVNLTNLSLPVPVPDMVSWTCTWLNVCKLMVIQYSCLLMMSSDEWLKVKRLKVWHLYTAAYRETRTAAVYNSKWRTDWQWHKWRSASSSHPLPERTLDPAVCS